VQKSRMLARPREIYCHRLTVGVCAESAQHMAASTSIVNKRDERPDKKDVTTCICIGSTRGKGNVMPLLTKAPNPQTCMSACQPEWACVNPWTCWRLMTGVSHLKGAFNILSYLINTRLTKKPPLDVGAPALLPL
jgi:hypothetical protein